MASFTAYVDAGGTTDPAPVYALGCVVATPEQWGWFDSEWRALRAQYGLPDPFHMTDFYSSRQQFTQWQDDPQRMKRFKDFLRVGAQHLVLSAGHAVDRAEYSASVPADVEGYVGGSPYGFLFMHLTMAVDEVLAAMARFGEIERDYRVAYVAEAGDLGANAILDAYNKGPVPAPGTFFERIDSVTTATKGTFSALELADIVAWGVHRNIATDFGYIRRETSPLVETLFARPHHWGYYKQDGLQLRHDVNVIQQILGQPKKELIT